VTVRGILATIYCVLLTLGTWWIVQGRNTVSVDFVVARDLPFNHLLRDGDVVQADWNELKSAVYAGGPNATDFVGRYTRGDLPKGAALRLDATDTVPNLATIPGHVALLATLPRNTVGTINAGSCVRLQVKDQAPFKVRTTLCPAAPQADCAALLDVPMVRLAEINATPVVVTADVLCQ